jgi:hypothetical protein
MTNASNFGFRRSLVIEAMFIMSAPIAQNDRPKQAALGVTVATVAAAVITAFSSVAPAAFHKLILFSIAYGAAVGGIIVWAASEFGLSRKVGLPLTMLLIVCGLTSIAVSRHQRLRQEAQAAAKQDAKQMMGLNLLKSAAADDPEIAADYERHRRRLNPTFADYLAVRVRPLGEWEHPWPSLFWAAELCLALSAGLLLYWKLSNRQGCESDRV